MSIPRLLPAGVLVIVLMISGCTQQQEPTPEQQSHLACVDLACTTVDGAGANECTSNRDCSHLTCIGTSCSPVQGGGDDACTTDEDCVAPVETHLTCIGESCQTVNGAGANTCTTDADCASHLECVSQTCTTVAGEGTDTCTTVGEACGVPTDGPDLIVSEFTANVTNVDGDLNFTVRLDAVLGNQGTKKTLNFTTRVEIVGQPVLDKYTFPLDTGRTRTVSGYFELPAGTYTARSIVDVLKAVNETNEQNNEKEITFTV